MERFIVCSNKLSSSKFSEFKIQYGEIYSIKCHQTLTAYTDLKSSMERFIVALNGLLITCQQYLKSSMERFIVCFNVQLSFLVNSFKIQYGEIYSHLTAI